MSLLDHMLDDAQPNRMAARLETLREVLGYAQKDFALRAGLSPQRYNNYINGRSQLSVDAAIRISATYSVTLDYLLVGDPSGLPYRLAAALKAIQELREKGVADLNN